MKLLVHSRLPSTALPRSSPDGKATPQIVDRKRISKTEGSESSRLWSTRNYCDRFSSFPQVISSVCSQLDCSLSLERAAGLFPECVVFSVGFAVAMVIDMFSNPERPLFGWPSLMTAVAFTAGVTNVMHLCRNLVDQAKKRPIYVIAERAASSSEPEK
jgi:hypothetical protein